MQGYYEHHKIAGNTSNQQYVGDLVQETIGAVSNYQCEVEWDFEKVMLCLVVSVVIKDGQEE